MFEITLIDGGSGGSRGALIYAIPSKSDSCEVPILLVALTLALTYVESRLNGAAQSTEFGIVQRLADTIAGY